MIVKIIIIFIITGIVFVFADTPPVLIYELYRMLFIFIKKKRNCHLEKRYQALFKISDKVIFHFIFQFYE